MVCIAGWGHARLGKLPMSRRDMLAFGGPRRAIHAACARAGITVEDIDVAEVHDCFTIAEPGLVFNMGGSGVANRASVLEGAKA